MSNHAKNQTAPSVRRVFSNLSPRQQIGYGCIAIVIIGTTVLYCAGAASFIIRPSLENRPATPTVIIRATLAATPTQAQPTLINLPRGTLLATPTQAPIPTRELPTLTPTVDLTNPAPTGTITPTIGTRVTNTPTRRLTPTTPRP